MLFSEPKIPQFVPRSCLPICSQRFQCSSASRKFLNDNIRCQHHQQRQVSVLFSEPKIPQYSADARGADRREPVSVLFSEPKIPQSPENCHDDGVIARFSALQRAENSSMRLMSRRRMNALRVSVLFSEPKIPQFLEPELPDTPYTPGFQCSSASRKFLNVPHANGCHLEPPQVSVLFSEPKIPQCRRRAATRTARRGFSALQRAENSSIVTDYGEAAALVEVVSVLFSEPKIPQYRVFRPDVQVDAAFQCSSASRKFLNDI